jgi:cytoskeletal protein RodZ
VISSAAVDIYALGATLFELLLGARYDKCPVSEAPYHEHRDRKLDELRSALSGGDWELVSLVTDMLDYAPRRRPSASEVVQRIDGIMVDRADREGLALWAARVLPDLVAPPRELPADDLVDRTFTEMPSPLIERESGPLCEDPVLPPAGSSPSSEAPEPAEKSPAAGVSGSELSRPRPAPRVATGLIVVALLGALGLWLLTARERDASLLEPSQVSGEGTGSASAYREVPIDLVPERHESEPIPNESRAEELEHPAQLTEASVEEAGEPDVASIAAPLPVLAPPQRAVQVRQTSPPPTEHTATVEPGNGDVASFQATPAVLEPAQELTEAPESAGSAGSQCAVTVQGLEAATLSKEAFGGDLVDLPARVTAGSWSLSGAFPGEPVSDKGHYVIGAEWELARFDCTDTEARQRGRCALVRLR